LADRLHQYGEKLRLELDTIELYVYQVQQTRCYSIKTTVSNISCASRYLDSLSKDKRFREVTINYQLQRIRLPRPAGMQKEGSYPCRNIWKFERENALKVMLNEQEAFN
jgi:hypothetical protein